MILANLVQIPLITSITSSPSTVARPTCWLTHLLGENRIMIIELLDDIVTADWPGTSERE